MLTVHLLAVIAVFSSSPSSFCLATNKDTFVNTTRSPLKILGVFGHYGKSHFDVFKSLLEELARRGHHVTVISHFPRSESAKAKEPLPTYRDISILDPKHGVYVEVIDLNAITHNFVRVVNELLVLRIMADSACKAGLNHPAVQEFVRSDETFDVVLTESFNTDCFLSIIHKFHVPYIGMSSHQIMPWINANLGNEDNPSYIPMSLLGPNKPMDLFNRMLNTLLLPFVKAAYHYWFRYKDQTIANQAFGQDLPKLENIAKKVQIVLLNTHNSLHGSVPFLPSVVEIGGMHIPSRTKPLPKDIAEYLDNAHEGVLYFSLGSMIKMTTMPPEKLDAIFDVLGSIPQKVIWKWEDEVLPRKLDNVMTKKWLPQFDVLSK